jgi:ferredoxin
MQSPAARSVLLSYLDVAVLALALSLSSWFVYQKRSRKAVMTLSIFSLLYFGFWRKGCVCSIGSLQNVALALFDSSYGLPFTVLAFFSLPLVFALFWGRTFCASVCPHGALQDLVHLKPTTVPFWLEQGLALLPYLYLGAAVLLAATGSGFIICQYDPFVPLFRMNGRALMVLTGIGLLVLGVFVGRPYCRFLCPYGVLLKLSALVAKWRVRVTPDVCTQCRLCEASCPFGAMREPEPAKVNFAALAHERQRLLWLLLLLPVLIAAGGWLGWRFSAPASRMHPTVRLAELFLRERNAPPPNGPLAPEDYALERARSAPGELLNEASTIQHRFAIGGWFFGGWFGAVVGARQLNLSLRRRRMDFEPDRGACFACARCFEFCPNERARRGLIPEPVPLASVAAPSPAPLAQTRS